MKRNLYISLLKSIVQKDFFIIENTIASKSPSSKSSFFSKKLLKQCVLDVFLLHFELVKFINLCYIFSRINLFRFLIKLHQISSITFLKNYLVHSQLSSISLAANSDISYEAAQLCSNCALITSSDVIQPMFSLKPKFLFSSESNPRLIQKDYVIRNTLKTTKKLFFLISLLELSINLKEVASPSSAKFTTSSSSYFSRKYKNKKRYNVKLF